jgi:transposase
MSKVTKIIDKELVEEAEKALDNLGCDGVVAIRLKAIIASYKHGLKKVSEVYDINRSSLHRWVALFKSGGVESIKNISKSSRSKLNIEQKNELKLWIEADSGLTIKAIKIKIKEQFDIDIEKSSIHRMIHGLGFSHITGRKKHYKSNQSAQVDFKKKSRT